MLDLIPGIYNQERTNPDHIGSKLLKGSSDLEQPDLEEVNAQLEKLDPVLVGKERYENTAWTITKLVVNIFYYISNLWNSSKIKALKEQFDYSNFSCSSESEDSEFKIDCKTAEKLAALEGTVEEIRAQEREILRSIKTCTLDEEEASSTFSASESESGSLEGPTVLFSSTSESDYSNTSFCKSEARTLRYDSCDEEQDVLEDSEERILQQAAPSSPKLKDKKSSENLDQLPVADELPASPEKADKADAPQDLAPQRKKSKKKKHKQRNMAPYNRGFKPAPWKRSAPSMPKPLNSNSSRNIEIMRVSSAPAQPAVVTPEVMPQVEENQAMQLLETFDHPFITEKFTEENVQNVENVDGGIQITLKDKSVITAKKEDGKLLLSDNGLQKFAEDYFKSQFDSEGAFQFFWNRYLEDHTLQTLEVQEDQSIHIVSNAPIDSNKCRSDLELVTQNNSFDINGKHPLIDFKEMKTITQHTSFVQGNRAELKPERWDLEMNDGKHLMVERGENEGLKLSGSALPDLMDKQMRYALGEDHKTFLPLNKIQSVFVSYIYDIRSPNKLHVDFGESLEGTTNQVEEGGWQDMKHNRIVLEKDFDIAITPKKGVGFEKGKVRMGVHIEDYRFILGLTDSPKTTHTVLNLAGYTEFWNPNAVYAMEFSMAVTTLFPTENGFTIAASIDDKDKTLKHKKAEGQIQGYIPGDTIHSQMKEDLDYIPLKGSMYQDSFAHFEWQALSE